MLRKDLFISILLLSAALSCQKKSDDDPAPQPTAETPLTNPPTEPTDPVNPPPTPVAETVLTYAAAQDWLCLPGQADVCAAEPSTSEMLADATFAAVPPDPSADESVDCFYVHPTSDLSVKAGNSENFEYLEPVQQLAQMQAAPFRGACKIYAPLYHQVTIGTYALPADEQEPFLTRAATDVLNAFDYYMQNYNQGRKIVFIGHSQGSEMITRVLQQRFDLDPLMRSKLILAIIPGFAVHAPFGTAVGSSFSNIPACTTAGETSCVIAFRSYQNDTAYLGNGSIALLELEEEVCVNPATLDDPLLSVDDRRSARAPLLGTLLPPPQWVSDSIKAVATPTPFVKVNAAYSAACDAGPDPRNRYLSIEENLPDTDPRHGIVLMDSDALKGLTGLHTLDMQFPMAELVKLVKSRR